MQQDKLVRNFTAKKSTYKVVIAVWTEFSTIRWSRGRLSSLKIITSNHSKLKNILKNVMQINYDNFSYLKFPFEDKYNYPFKCFYFFE